MRALVLLAVTTLVAISCGQEKPAAVVSNPSPVPAVFAKATPTAAAPELPSPTPTPFAIRSPTPSPMPAPTPSPAAAPTPTIIQLLDRCPTPAELASVDSALTMTFTSDPSAGVLVCTAAHGSRDLTLLQERAYQAVLIFTWVSFDAPLPWTNLNLDAWFPKAIHGVTFRGDTQYSYCCDGGAIVIQTNNLAVLSKEIAPSDSVRELAALFIHEARHNEGYVHTCGAWDNTIAELGSWSVQYYFLLWLGTHSDPAVIPEPIRSAIRQEAESFAVSIHFCNPPLSPTP